MCVYQCHELKAIKVNDANLKIIRRKMVIEQENFQHYTYYIYIVAAIKNSRISGGLMS